MKNNKPVLTGNIAGSDIRQLRIFKAVVECGGFSAAEADLNITRAAISIAMTDLEQRLSLRLCERGRSGFSLTHEGQQIYGYSLQLLSAMEDFRTQVNSTHANLKGELNIGITDNLVTMPRMLITHAIKALKQQGPEVQINILMTPPSDIEAGVQEGRLHTGVVPLIKHLTGLDYIPLYEEESNLYCSTSHPLFRRSDRELSRADIESFDAVLPAYSQAAETKAIYPSMQGNATATDREGIAFLVLTGQYIGYLPVHFAERWVREGSLRALQPKQLRYTTEYAAITRKGARFNLVLTSYLQQLKSRI
ncbi:MAG: DNA-binding transcriptional LysR family regulator [Motiliproteus sp.]|jgi:DNA-binding transcriptional LysR family regulator